MKKLYFGDCLDILKDLNTQNSEGFIDLIYIDPPFNSKRNYNILFEDLDMRDTKAQREAFADTWSNVGYKDELSELADLNYDLHKLLKTFDEVNLPQSSVAYLTTMAIRIHFMHKVLKDTGSFYIHCDTNMSHYLKIICDLIFGKDKFRNEIIWKRTFNSGSSKSIANKFPVNTDSILFYTKSKEYLFNKLFRPLSEGAEKRYDKVDENGIRFKWNPLKTVSAIRLKEMLESGEAQITSNSKYPVYKHYYTKSKGALIDNNWIDIEQMGTKAQERLGYPTQKPEALLDRIIKVSSKEGDLIADFFCGCGTTIAVANKLNRQWLGVDISHLAIKLIINRIIKPLSDEVSKNFLQEMEVHGFPKDIDSAKELARKDLKGRFEFQAWVVEFLLGGILNPKKTADGGWDGYITFPKSEKDRGRILIEVKSGNVNVKNIREFLNVVHSREADMGIFVCFAEQVTNPMLSASKDAGKYQGYHFDKIQIITIEELLEGKMIKMPGGVDASIFKQATRDVRPEKSGNGILF